MIAGQIVVAEVYCIGCGRALRLTAAAGACPACGRDIGTSLGQTILAGGHRHVRRVSRALLLAGALNVGLALGCVLNPATMWVTGWYRALGVVFQLSVVVYAWLQVLAAWRAAAPRPDESSHGRRALLLLSGSLFAAATMAGLVVLMVDEAGLDAGWSRRLGQLSQILLPALVPFMWMVGSTYCRLCAIGGMKARGRRCQLVKLLNTAGAIILTVGYLLVPLGPSGLPQYHASRTAVADSLVVVGLAIVLTGMIMTTALQFVMAQRLRELSETLGDRAVLTGVLVE